MYEWLILVANLATVVPGGGDALAERVIAPAPAVAAAIYVNDDVDEVLSPLPGTTIEAEEGDAK